MLFFGRGNGKRKFSFIALFNDERRIQSGALPNFCDDLKNYNDTFLLSYFSVTKSTKSHQRERSPLFENSSRVHELVAGSSARRVRAAKGRDEIGSVALPAISAVPRVRTYRTKKPSRFVHALSARPHNRVGGRVEVPALTGWSTYFLLFLLAMLGLIS